MSKKVKLHKQEIQELIFKDNIGLNDRNSSFSLRVLNDKGKSLVLDTDFQFKLNNETKSIAFIHQKQKEHYGSLTYEFNLYTPSSLFAITEKTLRETLENIFKTEKCSNILGSHFFTAKDELALYYTTEVDFEKITKKYEYFNRFAEKEVATEPKEIEEADIKAALSVYQKELFYGLISEYIYEKASMYFSHYEDKKTYMQKAMNMVFGKTLLEDDELLLDQVLDITRGVEKISDLKQSDFPIQELIKLYQDEEITFKGDMSKYIRNIANASTVFVNTNVENTETIENSLKNSQQFSEQFYVPPYNVKDDAHLKPSQHHINKQAIDMMEGVSEVFYNASLLRAIESNHIYGSPAHLQSKAAINFAVIDKEDEVKSSLSLKTETPTALLYIKNTGSNNAEKIAIDVADSCRGEYKVAVPVKTKDGSYVVTIRQNGHFNSGGLLSSSDDLTLDEFKKLLNTGINTDNMYNVLFNNASKINGNIEKAIRLITLNTFKENTKKGLNGYINNFNKKVADNVKNAPRNEMIPPFFEGLKNEDMSFLAGMNHIGKNEKIFPDIVNAKTQIRMSLNDIASSLFHITRWLMIPEYHQTIKEQLERNGFVVPDIKPYKFNLIDPSKNIISDEKKQSVVSTKSHAGILNFQMLPTIIELGTEEEINKFLEYSAKAIAYPFYKDGNEDKFRDKFEQSYKELSAIHFAKLKECKYIFTKIQPYLDDGIIKQNEQFVGMDENLVEKIIFNIPVFNFYSVLKDNKLLSIENRTKNAAFRESDIELIFDGIDRYVNSIVANNSEIFTKIDKLLLPMIQKTLDGSESFSFNISNKMSLLNVILKSNNNKLLTDELSLKKENSVENKIENIFAGYNDEKSSHLKSSIISFYKANLQGKEHYLLDENKENKIKELFHKRFGHEDDRVTKSYGAIYESGAEIGNTLQSDIKAIMLRAYSVYIDNAKNKSLDSDDKNKLINDFLYQILGLEPHQSLEVKGFLALHQKENINTELLFWEARTKKSRTMMAILLLASLLEKSPSVFFLQNKNYDDLVGQAFDMLPFIVTDSSILLGTDVNYKAPKSNLPVVLSEFIFPNLVSALKRNRYIKNPTSSNDSPADILAQKYTNDFYKIFESISSDPEGKLFTAIKDNTEDYPQFDFYEKLIKKANTDTMKKIVATTYFYTIKLFLEGYLQNEDADEIADVVRRKINSFIKDYLKSSELSTITEDSPAKIVFAGKQFVDSFVAMNEKDLVLKSNNLNKDQLITQLDVDISTETTKEDLEEGGVTEKERMQKDILDNLKLSEKQKELSENSVGVLFLSSFAKQDKKYISSITKKINNEVNKVLDKYADSNLVDEDERKQFFAGYQIVRKMFTTNIANAIKDMETYSAYLDTESYKTDTVKYNDKPTNAILFKTDLMIADKIQKQLPKFLADAGVFEDEDRITEIINDCFYAQNMPQNISKAITLAGLEVLTRRAYFKEEAKTNSINRSITTLLVPTSMDKKIDKVSLELEFNDTLNGFLGIAKKETSTSAAIFHQFSLQLETESLDPSNPSYFTKNLAIPTKICISQESGKATTLEVLEGIDKKNKMPISLAKKDTKKLSSSYLWELEEEKIAAISIDEAHKNITGNKKKTTTALLRKIEKVYPEAIQIVSTGTPNKYGEFIEIVSGDIGSKAKRNIDKYCGLYEINSLFITALMEAIRKDKDVEKIIDDKVLHFLANITRKEDVEVYAGLTGSSLVDELLGNKTVLGIYKSVTNIKNTKENKNSISDVVRAILMKIGSKNINKKEMDSGVGLEMFERVVMEPKNGIAKKTAGVTNPLGLSDVFRFFDGSNVSIKRPSKGVKYEILDRLPVQSFGKRSFLKEPSSLGGKEDALQKNYLLAKKIFNTFAGREMFSVFESLFQLAENGMRENCESRLGMSLTRFNELCNRSQVSVPDSLKDIFMEAIKRGAKIDLHSDRMELLENILQTMDSIKTHNIDEIFVHSVASTTSPNLVVETKEGLEIECDRELIKTMQSGLSTMRERRIFINDFPAGFSPEDKNSYLVSITPNGLELHNNETNYVLRNNIEFEYQINPDLPNIEFEINLASPDDITIIENMSYSKPAIKLLEKHLNKSENTRQMTTRVALTEAAIAMAIKAGANREDKSRTLNIIAVMSDKRVLEYLDKVYDTSASYLRANNIDIIKTVSDDFNNACAPALNKGEQLMVVGNYASLAEGIAMDFIQMGTYVGALNNVSTSIQSFARQTGHRQQESRFYLANDGEMGQYDGVLIDRLKAIKSFSLNKKHLVTEGTAEDVCRVAVSNINKIKLCPPYTGNKNCSYMEHFNAYELIMTGDFALLEKPLTETELKQKMSYEMEYEIIEQKEPEEEKENEEEMDIKEEETVGVKL